MKKTIIWLLVLVFATSVAFFSISCKAETIETTAAATTAAETPAAATSAAETTVAATEEAKPLRFGLIPILLANSYHQSDVNHFVEYAKEQYGAETTVLDGKIDAAVTVDALEQLIASNVDAISVHSIDAESLIPGIKEARAAEIAILTFYLMPSEPVCPHVQIDERKTSYQMGVVAVEKWKEFYPDKPIKVGLIEYADVPTPLEHRSEPFIKGVMDTDPTAEVVIRLDGGGTTETAFAAAQDLLQSHPEVNILYGVSSNYSIGALGALEAAGRGKAVDGKPLTEILVGTDASEDELLKVFDPSSSFKITQGLTPKENAMVRVDTLMGIINGEIDGDAQPIINTFDFEIDYWNMTIEEASAWLKDQYYSKIDLKAEIEKNQ